MKNYVIKLFVEKKINKIQLTLLQNYFLEMPTDEILKGLKFAKNRWSANDAGILKVGRKSIIKQEIHSITKEQAKWRLNNWVLMITNYRKRGYSYTTIYRIKKMLIKISK